MKQAGRLALAGLKWIRVLTVFNTRSEWPGREPAGLLRSPEGYFTLKELLPSSNSSTRFGSSTRT
jgi:hypothetical protein